MPEVLAIICARGGSKALPRKNLAVLGGRPLIAWTIEAAKQATRVNRVVVSTDDEDIAAVAVAYGADVPFRRPAALAADDTPGIAPAIHAVEWLRHEQGYLPDVVAYLQPTSPFRTAADIDAAVLVLIDRDADSVVSVTPVDEHPYWMKRVDADGWMQDLIALEQPIVRRQDLPPVYALNGALYVVRTSVLLGTRGFYTARTAAYIMSADRSVDIDTAADFTRAEGMLAS